METVKIILDQAEYSGAVRLAERDLRSVPQQVRQVLREALIKEGLVDRRTFDQTDTAHAAARA